MRILVMATAAATGVVRYSGIEPSGEIEMPPDLHGVEISGDSMIPVALEGQHVLCTRQPLRDGDLAVIEATEEQILFKRIHWEGNLLACDSVSPAPGFPSRRLKRGEIRHMYRVCGVMF